MPDEIFRAAALTELAPHLIPRLLPQAFAATAMIDDSHCSQVLRRLAPYLPPRLLRRALATVTAMASDADRAWALAGLAPHVSADALSSVMAQALEAVSLVPMTPIAFRY
jgi:hypothetical protein